MENLSAMITACEGLLKKNKSPSRALATDLIKELRKSKVRRPDLVLVCAKILLKTQSGIEVWNLYEDLFLASLDTGDDDAAGQYLAPLTKEFPDSQRVKRLLGMRAEYKQRFHEAIDIYKSVLTENPSNLPVMKRMVACRLGQRNFVDAISELNKIVTIYPTDVSSWAQMAELYLDNSQYEAAAHCYEEAVIMEADSTAFHNRLAECYYSIGGQENMLNARKHYTISLNNQDPKFNLRAVWGLLLSSRHLATMYSSTSASVTSDEKNVNAALLEYAKASVDQLVSKGKNADTATAAALSAIVSK